MTPRLLFICALLSAGFAAAPARSVFAEQPEPAPVFVIVTGASGVQSYAEPFGRQAAGWVRAAAAQGARSVVIGQEPAEMPNDRAVLEQTLAHERKESAAPLWLVLIGHGTYDKKTARFNLRGDDVAAAELAAWLQPHQRPVAIINTTSASAPFVNALSAPGRVIITATRSGNEQNYTRFGSALIAALEEAATDLDQDSQVSLLEAFLTASHKVEEFYQNEGRLATEHALIDDNGDGLGTPAAWFRGLRAVKKPRDAAALDGLRAHQWLVSLDPAAAALPPEWRQRRDALEAAVTALREKKDTLSPEDYYGQLEAALLDLAQHYEALPEPAAP